MRQVPILFLSDSPDRPSGLGRICKDLAVHCCSIPELRVGVMGRGGYGSSKLPFAQYSISEYDQWGENQIEYVWNDFAGNDTGVIMTIWDASRLHWFSRPMMGGKLQEFLKSGRFQRWGYFPVDCYGIGEKLTGMMADTISGFDRILTYSIFGSQVLGLTLGKTDVNWIPHGYNEKVFQPRDRTAGRLSLGVAESDVLVGCVMTNQERKDWGTAFASIAHLRNRIQNLKFWCHVDTVDRHWNLMALANDLGIQNSTIVTITGDYNSEQLSYMYSACDVTMLPSLGEGFGYPIVESLACGVPVIHTAYAGGMELIPDRTWLVNSTSERLEGPWNCIRPVLDPVAFSNTLYAVIQEAKDGMLKEMCVNSISHLTWSKLWPSVWKRWFLEGIQ